MKIILFFTLICFPFGFLSAQEDEEEIIEEPLFQNYIKGTMALPISGNQLMARNFGIQFDSIIETPCQEDRLIDEESHIQSLMLSDSALIVSVKVVDNCCFSFICDIEIVEDSILNIIAYGYGESHCACYCCFGIDYYFTTNAYGENREFDRVKSVMVNGEKKTMMKIIR